MVHGRKDQGHIPDGKYSLKMTKEAYIEDAHRKKTVRISVRKLVEFRRRTGDLDLTFFSSPSPLEGIRLHQKIQRSRPEHYSPEKPISITIESEEITLTISGRIDGVYESPDSLVVEEIKTTLSDPDGLDFPEDHPHWAQLKCYGYMLAKLRKLKTVDLQLVCCNIENERVREFKRTFSILELQDFFDALTGVCFQKLRAAFQWEKKRDRSLNALPFPFDEYRPGQRQMAATVFRTIRDKGQSIIQAPTGIGKTIAAVFPALKAMGLGFTEKIFYLTARTTGKSAVENALKTLKNAGLSIKSITITAKGRICFNPDSLCNAQECEFAKGYYDRVNMALDALFEKDAVTRRRIESVATKQRVCPFALSLEASNLVDLVICDYNYAFDPRVYLKRFFLEENKDYTFLVDEAHNFVDRGREMFSASLSGEDFDRLLPQIRENATSLAEIFSEITRWFSGEKKKCMDHGGFFPSTSPPEPLLPLLDKCIRQCEAWLTRNRINTLRTEIIDIYFEVSNFMKIFGFYDQSYTTFFECSQSSIRIKIFCLDPSGLLKIALKRCSSAIFFSATMTPAEYFQHVLGCGESTVKLYLPSPFPGKNCLAIISDRISTYFRMRSLTKKPLAQFLLSLAKGKTGNYLFFFPSYQYLEMVLEEFRKMSQGFRTIVQKPGMTEAERDQFIQAFEENAVETLTGFAVLGGIFGEGIDLVGDRLAAAAIVGVGLPMICPERELIREYFRKKMGRGFDFAYKYPGINRVQQAAGRVIRSETDKGVLLFIDERFSRPDYLKLFPDHYTIRRIQNDVDFQKALEVFWM